MLQGTERGMQGIQIHPVVINHLHQPEPHCYIDSYHGMSEVYLDRHAVSEIHRFSAIEAGQPSLHEQRTMSQRLKAEE